jgi:AraC-like DNA-binding protein
MARVDSYDHSLWVRTASFAGYRAGSFARLLCISRRQLERYTLMLFKCSPQKWLNQQRLALAPELLRVHRSVKPVADILRYRQASHFSREFKRQYNLSPIRFLRLADQQAFVASSLTAVSQLSGSNRDGLGEEKRFNSAAAFDSRANDPELISKAKASHLPSWGSV